MNDAVLDLKKALLAEYGSFADQRIKNPAKGSVFIVDDRAERDVGADKHLYSYFCMMFAEVIGPGEVQVSLSGNIPAGAPVSAWAQKAGVAINGSRLTIAVTSGSLHLLPKLAAAFRAIVAPGMRYETANYKYVCPRTAGSLDRLAATLAKQWNVAGEWNV